MDRCLGLVVFGGDFVSLSFVVLFCLFFILSWVAMTATCINVMGFTHFCQR